MPVLRSGAWCAVTRPTPTLTGGRPRRCEGASPWHTLSTHPDPDAMHRLAKTSSQPPPRRVCPTGSTHRADWQARDPLARRSDPVRRFNGDLRSRSARVAAMPGGRLRGPGRPVPDQRLHASTASRSAISLARASPPRPGVWWHPTAWFGDADSGARVRYVRLWLSDEQIADLPRSAAPVSATGQCTGQRTKQSVGGPPISRRSRRPAASAWSR